MNPDRIRGGAPFRPHPAVVVGVSLRTGAVVVVLTLILGLLVLPGIGDVLAALSPGAAIGTLVLLSSAIRIAAGLFGARLLRRRYGATSRVEALASVVVGVVVAWLVYTGLVVLVGGSEGPFWRLLLELPRWVLEAGLGAVLVTPGESEPVEEVPWRFSRVPLAARGRGDRGAASLEYAGSLFVVVLVIASLVATITPIGAAIEAKICEALGAQCGRSAAQQRADALKITCTVSKRDRDLGFNVVVDGVRGQRKDADSITKYGDGSATVVVSQGSGLGLDGGSSAKSAPVGYTAQGTVNGDVGLVYRFPKEYGGAQAAQDFVNGRRDGWQQAAQIVTPGLQAVEEGATRAGNGLSNWWHDSAVPFFTGNEPSAQERADREVAHRKETADALQVSLSLQGSVGVNAGNGVKMPTGAPPSTPGGKAPTAPAGGAASANAKASLEVKGSATVGLDKGKPDSVKSSFTGSIKVDAEATAILGGTPGQDGGLPFLAFKGSAGAGGQYTVTYDDQGNPVKLVVTGEAKYGGGGGLQLPGGRTIGGKGIAQDINTHEVTMVLDLDTSTAQGRANRDAFDDFFLTTGFSVQGSQARMSVPAPVVNPLDFGQRAAALAQRISSDAFVVESQYSDAKDEGGGDLKVAGWGLGGSKNSTTRTLIGSTGYDLRNGGQPVTLANCGGK